MWFADAGLCKLFMVTVQAGFAFFFPPFSRVPSLASFFFSIFFFYIHVLIPASAFEAVVLPRGLRSRAFITPCYLLFGTVFFFFCTNLHFQIRNRGINAQAAPEKGICPGGVHVLGCGMGTAARGHWGSPLLGVTAGFVPSLATSASPWAGDRDVMANPPRLGDALGPGESRFGSPAAVTSFFELQMGWRRQSKAAERCWVWAINIKGVILITHSLQRWHFQD